MGRPDFNVLQDNCLEGFDVHLQEFYKDIIDQEIEFKSHVKEIKNNLKEIILHYKKENTEKLSIDLRFSTEVRRCAYVLKNSALFTITVAAHFSKLILKNKLILMKPFKNRKLHLCCLGGGPAPEVVGMVKVLALLYSSTGNEDPLKIKVTIVDIEEGWKITCEHVLKRLEEDDTFRGMDRINIDFEFVQADLTKPTIDVKNVIEKADIVTMVFFLSTINGGKYTEESYEMVKNIMEVIKTDGVLFFLNNATDVHFQQMDEAAKEVGDMEIIYEPCVEELCLLTPESVKKFLEIYEGCFYSQNCMTHGFMSYCAWRKTSQWLEIDEVEEEKRKNILKSQKNNENLTRKMKSYRYFLNVLNRDLNKYTKEISDGTAGIEENNSSKPNRETIDNTSLTNHKNVEGNKNTTPSEYENSYCEKFTKRIGVPTTETNKIIHSFPSSYNREIEKVQSQPESTNTFGNENRENLKGESKSIAVKPKLSTVILRQPHFKINTVPGNPGENSEFRRSLTDEEKLKQLIVEPQTSNGVKSISNDEFKNDGRSNTINEIDKVGKPWITDVKLRRPNLVLDKK